MRENPNGYMGKADNNSRHLFHIYLIFILCHSPAHFDLCSDKLFAKVKLAEENDARKLRGRVEGVGKWVLVPPNWQTKIKTN